MFYVLNYKKIIICANDNTPILLLPSSYMTCLHDFLVVIEMIQVPWPKLKGTDGS